MSGPPHHREQSHLPDRRTLLSTALGAAALGSGTGRAAALAPGAGHDGTRDRGNPFNLGIASGDPSPDGFVLWTRLAHEPLAEDGRGGMPDRVIDVDWQIAEDEGFRRVVRSGTEQALPARAHSVHVEPTGLKPDREYYYRFRVGRHTTRTGRTRTAPAPGAPSSSLTVCTASCAAWEHGFFTAYRRIAEEEPDLVLHLGDYIYELGHLQYPVLSGIARDVAGSEARTLADYRRRYAQYRTDPDLQLAHAVAPWVVVWDDHELDNNWAGQHPELPQLGFDERRAASFRAYYENMPLRSAAKPQGTDMRLYRRIEWGGLANFHVLDTRQYRDDQACGGLVGPCGAESAPERSITGDRQENWLLDGLRRSGARWDLLAQQVMFARNDTLDGPLTSTSMDTWDGYTASRGRITRGWIEAGVRNPVVLTGDIHEHYAADLRTDYTDPASEVVGSELVTTSVTSGGDAEEDEFTGDPDNPHIRFHSGMRGYLRTRITPEELRADFRVLPYVSRAGAPVDTKASFAVADGVPGLQHGTG
ncbi:alkaline phosphatase D family protein [Actinopolyspora saharensis]|uniref:Alkaline phosphatase D n=1 Tax=Actinopolyspora saharensis TaxID=995062 RepID=A0A1H1GNY7_9ACTN|nr:alkaline phosphatase D family protein [Actinopolyspora saharensis]SDR14912.1 alkaline phosphatase D [Actinopolyspora saharensis]